MSLRDWVQAGRKLGASDLHLEGGSPLVARVGGELRPVGSRCRRAVGASGEGDPGCRLVPVHGARFGGRLAGRGGHPLPHQPVQTIRGLAVAVRLLAPSVHDLRTCNLHPDLRRLIEPLTGLVVISGPTGCGKSTTLAALIEELNSTRPRHIITLESPLEYLFVNRRSFIRQREIPTHSPSFEQAIIDALRENPDVLVISEMRTPEVIRLTLNAAETGHLVLATMHSSTCAESLSRICMAFPPDIQANIRAQLADCLVGVVCQRLELLEAHQLRVPRCEVLLASSGAKGAIRGGQFSQIANVMQSGGDDGMWTFDRYQRWMEQQRDWVRAPPPGAVADELTAPPPALKPAPKPARPAAPQPVAGEQGPIEISIDEEVDLTELAKRIEQRTR